MSTFAVGDMVKAKTVIKEDKFNGHEVWTHAEPGDIGEVIHVGECRSVDLTEETDLPTVLFNRTGTSIIVAPTEIESLGYKKPPPGFTRLYPKFS